jgi:hypothetical protein
MADAEDLKSSVPPGTCGFESRLRHTRRALPITFLPCAIQDSSWQRKQRDAWGRKANRRLSAGEPRRAARALFGGYSRGGSA